MFELNPINGRGGAGGIFTTLVRYCLTLFNGCSNKTFVKGGESKMKILEIGPRVYVAKHEHIKKNLIPKMTLVSPKLSKIWEFS